MTLFLSGSHLRGHLWCTGRRYNFITLENMVRTLMSAWKTLTPRLPCGGLLALVNSLSLHLVVLYPLVGVCDFQLPLTDQCLP